MEVTVMDPLIHNERVQKYAPQLLAVLKEMKQGLDVVTSKVQALTTKVKENQFPTADGLSYLEAKHLLMLSYCQCIVYYCLRKAKGLSIDGHPVVRSLVEIRLFLEKIRPIDKKLEYQIRKLMRDPGSAMETPDAGEQKTGGTQKTEDLLKYRPNPDMLVSKTDKTSQDGNDLYVPPKFVPTTMEEDKMSKQDKLARRKEKEMQRKATQSVVLKDMMDELEGKPEEVRYNVGNESREVARYKEKMEDRAEREENLFTRAPLTKMEKKRERHMKKSKSGLLDLTDGFYDEVKALPLEEDDSRHTSSFINHGSGKKKFNKNKRKR